MTSLHRGVDVTVLNLMYVVLTLYPVDAGPQELVRVRRPVVLQFKS